MNKIYNILFATDFSRESSNAFDYALHLAASLKANITVIHIALPAIIAGDGAMLIPPIVLDTENITSIDLEHFVTTGLNNFQNQGAFIPTVHQTLRFGDVGVIICKAAQEQSFDLIVAGVRDNYDNVERFLGGTTHYISAYAHCPVLLVPPMIQWKPFQSILYASDLSSVQPYRIWELMQFLSPFRPTYHITHVRTPKKEAGDLYLYELEQFLKRNNNTNLDVQFHQLIQNSVQEGLHQGIALWDADLLAMYSPHHSSLYLLFSESQSQNVIGKIKIPLLLLKGH